MTLEPDQG